MNFQSKLKVVLLEARQSPEGYQAELLVYLGRDKDNLVPEQKLLL